ncbi:TPA: EpsG family protein [Escherichia coli]|nr:EpsG family protein [Escherichia coli]
MIFYEIAIFIFACCVIEFSLKILNAGNYGYLNKVKGLNFKLCYSLVFIFLAIFSGFRTEGVDRDYPEYLNMLAQVPPFPKVLTSDLSGVHGDPIFYFISSLVNAINGEPFILFFAFSLTSLALYRWCFINYSYFPFLSLFIYFCHSFLNKEMTQIRNGLSSAFLLVMLCCLSERKKIKSILFLILSFLAHSSGLVGILLYFNRIFSQKNNVIYYVGFVVSLVLYFFWYQLFLLLPQSISIVQNIQQYISWDLYNYSLSLFNPVLLKGVLYFILFVYIKGRFGLNKRFDIFIFSYFLSICFYIAFNDIAILGARIASTLSGAEFILIPAVINRLLECNKKLEAAAIFLVTVFISVVFLYSNLEIKNIFGTYDINIFA